MVVDRMWWGGWRSTGYGGEDGGRRDMVGRMVDVVGRMEEARKVTYDTLSSSNLVSCKYVLGKQTRCRD